MRGGFDPHRHGCYHETVQGVNSNPSDRGQRMKVAVLGASGLVGRTMLEVLSTRSWVDEEPRLLVSERSAGTLIRYGDRELACAAVEAGNLAGLDVLLCSAGREAARKWAPVAAAAGALVVDNSSCFRLDQDVPLVVPEVNQPPVDRCRESGGLVIANPNCSTIQMAVFAGVLAREFGLKELHAVTLQAVSGAGLPALEQWEQEKADPEAPAGTVFQTEPGRVSLLLRKPLAHRLFRRGWAFQVRYLRHPERRKNRPVQMRLHGARPGAAAGD